MNEEKQKVHESDVHDSEYVMTYTTAITSMSNTLKKMWVQLYLQSSYIQTIYNDKE